MSLVGLGALVVLVVPLAPVVPSPHGPCTPHASAATPLPASTLQGPSLVVASCQGEDPSQEGLWGPSLVEEAHEAPSIQAVGDRGAPSLQEEEASPLEEASPQEGPSLDVEDPSLDEEGPSQEEVDPSLEDLQAPSGAGLGPGPSLLVDVVDLRS